VDVIDRPIHSELRKSHDQRGQAMVEFALVLPVLAILIVAIAQLGLLLNAYLEVTDAARVGARKASVSRKDGGGVAAAIAAARESTSHLDVDDLDVTVTPKPWPRGTPIEVRVTYPVSIDIFGLVVKSGVLEAEATARSQ
jgi:Na+-transporting methylmalonyl-CoA/oxaloacetate decarboxylase gamma subunit